MRRKTFAFLMLLLVFSGTFIFAQTQPIKSEFDTNDWWAQEAATFFPKYQFTLASTNPALQKTAQSTPDAILATSTWTGGTSSLWSLAGNWTGGVPTTTSDVTFSGTPTNFPDQPSGTTILRSIAFSSDAASYTGLNTSTEIFALRDAGTFTALTQASANLQTLNQLDIYLTTAAAGGLTATINLSGTGGLTLTEGLRWGLGTTGTGQQFIIQGPGALTVNGTFRGDLNTTGGTGGTSRVIFLNGDATSGQTVTFNPTSTSTWGSLNGVTLAGRVTLNLANAGAFDAGTFTFASGTQNASMIITGTNSGSTFDRNIAWTGGSVTGGTQTLGVDLTGSASATFSGTVTMAGTGNTVALSAGSGDTATFSGLISGSRPMLITGGGTVVLTNGGNTQSGGTTVDNATTLQISDVTAAAGRLGTNATTATIQGASTLEYTGTSQTNTGTYIFNIGTGGGFLKVTTSGTTLDLNNAGASTNRLTGSGALTKTGAGTLQLTASNTFNGSTTISAGTLDAGATNALGSTSGIKVNTGGTLLLSSASTNRINDSATMTLNGGTFNTAGLSERNLSGAVVNPGIGALTLQSSSIIDLASGASILAFANSSGATWSGTLSIYNWSGTLIAGNGTDQVYFGTNALGLTLSQLGQISFYSDSGSTFLGSAVFGPDLDGEIIPGAPVPEPSTWVGGALAVGVVGWSVLKRRKTETLKS